MTCFGHTDHQYSCTYQHRDSAVGTASGYGLDDRRVAVRVPVGEECSRHRGTPNLLVDECRGSLSPGVKRPGREGNHSPPTSAEVKNTWIYTSTPPYVFMAW
jgi:hypothetical protein